MKSEIVLVQQKAPRLIQNPYLTVKRVHLTPVRFRSSLRNKFSWSAAILDLNDMTQIAIKT